MRGFIFTLTLIGVLAVCLLIAAVVLILHPNITTTP